MQTQPEWGVTAQPRGASMRNEIIAYATELFPEQNTMQALEMFLLAVYSTIDALYFAEEEAKDYPNSSSAAEDEAEFEVWDYVY